MVLDEWIKIAIDKMNSIPKLERIKIGIIWSIIFLATSPFIMPFLINYKQLWKTTKKLFYRKTM
jgi:hypothetical protein